MDLFKLLQSTICLIMMFIISVEPTVLVHFDQVPESQSKSSSIAVFRYSIVGLNGSQICQRRHWCSISCQIDDQILKHCPNDHIILRNLSVNRSHNFRVSVTTLDGDRNSSAYKWFIDTIPPTASITSETSYTNAMRVSIDITFSEACTKGGGFKCINASSCDASLAVYLQIFRFVLINGPAEVNASTLKMVEQDIKYRIVVEFSASGVYGRVVVKMADMFCTDEAGNQFRRTNESVLILHFDRRPVDMGLWTTIPSYELKIGEVPRTVLATNKLEDLEFYLDFSSPVVNLTDDIQSVLHANFGSLALL
ncbi:uncharacterized protein LOC113278708 [Papaver somniferum]|uniref:uncharacterized protein LOC113278708 n=1 Tax=Papaver somniferum TaxID=3469 RepID=UPI000E70463E|nr:uncharacterized protein LOC113278708 [Papaver somniferum]